MSFKKLSATRENRMDWIPLDSEEDWMQNSNSQNSQSSRTASCSLCGHPCQREESKVFPFCSVRCQQVDLGLWLDEKLGLPIEGQEEQEFHGDSPEL